MRGVEPHFARGRIGGGNWVRVIGALGGFRFCHRRSTVRKVGLIIRVVLFCRAWFIGPTSREIQENEQIE